VNPTGDEFDQPQHHDPIRASAMNPTGAHHRGESDPRQRASAVTRTGADHYHEDSKPLRRDASDPLQRGDADRRPPKRARRAFRLDAEFCVELEAPEHRLDHRVCPLDQYDLSFEVEDTSMHRVDGGEWRSKTVQEALADAICSTAFSSTLEIATRSRMDPAG
jgi:hypothetical protein